ncbi:MAG: hypothetical protein HYR94_18290 [Chloroflexi bacterium]|nr:hypothetical protein [Chloroflexota bacterium]
MTTEIVTWQEALVTVEKLSWPDQLRLISELLLRMQILVARTEPIDLLTLVGVGADVWSKIDINTYLDQERDSWQN